LNKHVKWKKQKKAKEKQKYRADLIMMVRGEIVVLVGEKFFPLHIIETLASL